MRSILILAVAVWILGAALRIHDIGELSLAGDEFYTLDEAMSGIQDPDELEDGKRWRLAWARRTNPLTQVLGEFSVGVFGATPFAVRWFPLLFGLLALAWLPWLMRRIAGTPAALWTLTLLATCPLHIQFCRFARYQSATFLFGGVATLATVLWARDRRPRDGVLAILAGSLAVASHVSSALLILSLGLLVVLSVRPGKPVVFGLLGLGGLTTYLLRTPIGKTLNVIRIGIDRTGAAPGPLRLMAAGGYTMGPLLLLTAVVQMVAGLRERDRTTWMLTVSGVLPGIGVALLSYTEEVGIRYFATAMPSFLCLAALGAERIAAGVHQRRVLVASALCLAQVPLLISDQVDGHRHDYRAAAVALEELAGPTDYVAAKWHANLSHYYEGPCEELDYTGFSEQMLTSGADRAFAVILYQRGQPVFPDAREHEWLITHGHEVRRIGRPRLDRWLYHFELGVYEIDVQAARDGVPTH